MLPKNGLSCFCAKSFNIDNIHRYHLSISIGRGALKVCCLEDKSYACILLATWSMPLDSGHPSYIKALEACYNAHFFLLKKNWHSITLSLANEKFTLLPARLVSKNHLSVYMHAACGLTDHDELLSFTHSLAKISSVFGENGIVLDWFRQRYMGGNFYIVHQANAIIEGFYLEYPVLKKVTLLAWLEVDAMHIFVRDQGQLIYCNTFPHDNADNFLFYLFAVFQALDLSPEHCSLVVGGQIVAGSLAYHRLKSYVRDVKCKTTIHFLSTEGKIFKKSYGGAMVYFDLLSSFLCHPHVFYSKS